ncbi:hypothetical protein HY497_00485 [Candidatus Woesearchaeota archaeon]|nr:hypothetical protein [Candidatus Woesearchaeota archaeon]
MSPNQKSAGEKSVCGTWDAKCTTKNDPAIIGWYPAGPTKGCWEGEASSQSGQQCFCRQKAVENENTKKNAILKQGAAYAGTETGKLTDAAGNPQGVDGSGGQWPWNYREWQIYEQTRQAGIYYPKERYYDGRDFPGAFGQNYLLDRFFGTYTPKVDPFTQDIGAVQSVCLTTIRARLRLLQSILLGLQGCLKSIETTGKADAGVCKEVFSQFVCNLAYKAVSLFENRCVPEPNSETLGKEEPDLVQLLGVGSRALTDTLQQTQRELESDYGNAKLNQYLEGGTQTLMKKVCLAAFGIENGLDFDGLIDGEYSAAFKSTATILSSEGAKGRREFLSFNPQNFNSIYEYRAAWLITAGCDLESYRIDLVAAKEDERRQFPNINCADVNDQEAGSSGCDNFRSSITVRPQPFYSGGRVAAGSYIDMNKATNIESPYRYDHMKVTLFVDPRQDAKKCIPDENRAGDTGVFYFPIHDATGQDVLQCNLSPTNGQFLCQISGLSGLGQAYIENVQCYDPRIADYTRCDRVTLTLADEDPVKARISVFSSGDNKFCMNTYAQTTSAGNTEQRLIEIPGIGRPGSIPLDVTLVPRITTENFRGREEGISLINSFTTGVQPCTWDFDTQYDIPDKSKKGGGQTAISFTKSGDGYKVTLGDGITVAKGEIKSGTAYTADQLRAISYLVRGYGIRAVVPVPGPENDIRCTFDPRRPKDYAPQEQDWKLHFNLMYPDKVSGVCIPNGAPLASLPSLAFDTKKTETVRVRDTQTEKVAASAYLAGKRLFNEARGGTTAQRTQRYESAISELSRTGSATAEGTKEELLGYWWTVAAYAHLWRLKQGDQSAQATINQRLLATANIFARRIDAIQAVRGRSDFAATPPASILLNMPEIRLAKAYIGEIEDKIGKDTKVNNIQLCGSPLPECVECYQMEQAWKELFGEVSVIRDVADKYFNPGGTAICTDSTGGAWVVNPVYPDPVAAGTSGASSGAGTGAGGGAVSGISKSTISCRGLPLDGVCLTYSGCAPYVYTQKTEIETDCTSPSFCCIEPRKGKQCGAVGGFCALASDCLESYGSGASLDCGSTERCCTKRIKGPAPEVLTG